MSLKKSNICFFSLNLDKFTPDRKFLHRHVCGVCDKYEVCLYNDFTEVGRDACEDVEANWQKLVDIGWGAN